MQLIIWNIRGKIIVNQLIESNLATFSAEHGADFIYPELDQLNLIVQVNSTSQEAVLHYWQDGRKRQTINLNLDHIHNTRLFSCALISAEASAQKLQDSTSNFEKERSNLHGIVKFFGEKLRAPAKLNDIYKKQITPCLQELVKLSRAKSGMIILSEKNGLQLAAQFGCTAAEAQGVWEKMPEDLPRQVLKGEINIVLPRALQKSSYCTSTVYIGGVKTSVGLPLWSQGHLFGFCYLNFDNILRDFSEDLHFALLFAADALGWLLQRTELNRFIENQERARPSPLELNATSPLPNQNRLMIGDSDALSKVYTLIQKLAPTDVAVLVQGETGTGKELAARELHRLSNRRDKPFVAFNAAAIPDNLVESELFGHKKGAFTGALSDRIGIIEQAQGGTLFIDEVADLPMATQAKLLRVLQDKQVQPIGATKSKEVDFRILAASHADLTGRVKQQKFREDLYYRLAGVVINLPALRERREDIPLLANYFKQSFIKKNHLADKEWSSEALREMIRYSWPGNIRELAHVVGRALVLAEGKNIRTEDLDLSVFARAGATSDGFLSRIEPLDRAKDFWLKSYLTAALAAHQGNRSHTAKTLQIGERTLFRYIEQLDIH